MRQQGESPLNILMIDTSTDNAIVAVRAGSRFSQRVSHSRAAHSGIIFSHIDETLAETGITIHDIELIGTGIGPGSFTGLRIAVSTTRMIAQLLRVPLVGLHSQYLYASALAAFPDASVRQGDFLLPAFDAKKSRVFAGLYRYNETGLETVLQAGDYYPSEIANVIPEGDKVIACGSGGALCKDALNGDRSAFFCSRIIFLIRNRCRKHLPACMNRIRPGLRTMR